METRCRFSTRKSRALVTWSPNLGIDVLWHPSLGMDMGDMVQATLKEITSGKRELDIFVFEGSVIMGPNGFGALQHVR